MSPRVESGDSVETVEDGTRDELLDELNGLRDEVSRLEDRLAHYARTARAQQAMLDTVPALIFCKDLDNRILFANQSLADTLGIPKELLKGASLDELMPNQAKKYRKDDQKIISSGKAMKGIVESADTPAGLRWFSTDKAPLTDTKGEVLGLVGSAIDITEKKRAEDARKALVRDLRARNEALNQFARTVAHDLKAPLTVMTAFLSKFRDDVASEDSESIDQDLEFVEGSVKKMSGMMEDLLQLSQIGHEERPSDPTSMRDIAADIAELFRPLLENSSITVTVHPSLPHVYMSELRLREVLTNLIENAIKYIGSHPDPHIEIGVQIKGDRPVFFVRDNGIGIESHHHESVFGPFAQVDKNCKGRGVGLALVKRIVESHDGEIWIESAGRGKGTTFCFTAPLRPH